MGFLKFIVWTTCAVWLGIYLATGNIDGRTPLQHLERAWKRHASSAQVVRMKEDFQEALGETKKAVNRPRKEEPEERITAEDRAALERLLAQKK